MSGKLKIATALAPVMRSGNEAAAVTKRNRSRNNMIAIA